MSPDTSTSAPASSKTFTASSSPSQVEQLIAASSMVLVPCNSSTFSLRSHLHPLSSKNWMAGTLQVDAAPYRALPFFPGCKLISALLSTSSCISSKVPSNVSEHAFRNALPSQSPNALGSAPASSKSRGIVMDVGRYVAAGRALPKRPPRALTCAPLAKSTFTAASFPLKAAICRGL